MKTAFVFFDLLFEFHHVPNLHLLFLKNYL
jgi:hypothetical protein